MSENKTKRPKVDFKNVRAEAGHLIREHRKTLAVGMVLMVINRLAGLVIPAMPRYLLDEVVGANRPELLKYLVAAAAGAALIQAATSFSLARVVSVAAQGAIARMRKDVQAHVLRLPVSYFDSTKTGVLISRIMTPTPPTMSVAMAPTAEVPTMVEAMFLNSRSTPSPKTASSRSSAT